MMDDDHRTNLFRNILERRKFIHWSYSIGVVEMIDLVLTSFDNETIVDLLDFQDLKNKTNYGLDISVSALIRVL